MANAYGSGPYGSNPLQVQVLSLAFFLSLPKILYSEFLLIFFPSFISPEQLLLGALPQSRLTPLATSPQSKIPQSNSAPRATFPPRATSPSQSRFSSEQHFPPKSNIPRVMDAVKHCFY